MPSGDQVARGCPRPVTRVKLICSDPSPTRPGGGRVLGKLALKYRWLSAAVVTPPPPPQDSPAQLRVECPFTDPVYVVTASIALRS